MFPFDHVDADGDDGESWKATTMMRGIERTRRVLGRADTKTCFIAVFLLSSGNARAQNYPVLTFVPGHVYVVQGASIRNGDYLVLEPSGLFFFEPIARPVAFVARPMLGVGGSGVGLGLALNVAPRPGYFVRRPRSQGITQPFGSRDEGHRAPEWRQSCRCGCRSTGRRGSAAQYPGEAGPC